MGRLILNVLLSFAQFERELISERTRDKIAAARRKGKWSGGMPRLGYDLDLKGKKLVVNQQETARVRAIFQLYLEYRALVPVVHELERRGWVNKRWVTRKGHARGGRPFTKPRLYELLTNVLYLGKVRHKHQVHKGEHEAIVPAALWDQVQTVLKENGSASAAVPRNPTGALLQGLLRCVACDCAMTPSHATKRGKRRYRYYLCTAAQKRGRHTCPAPALPAAEIERFVLDRLQALGHQPVAEIEGGGDVGLQEIARSVRALIERVDYDGACDKITIRLHPVGVPVPAHESLFQLQEAKP